MQCLGLAAGGLAQALACPLQQQVLQGGLGPVGRILVYPHLPGNLVGGDETDPPHDPSQPVGVLLNDLAGFDISAEDVWPTYTSDGINVVVVDDGMHYTHEDLKDNVDVSRNHNYDPDATDIYSYFDCGGTAVAGLIAANDNDKGVRGVAPEATIYGYNYLQSTGDANRADAMSLNSATTAVSNSSWGPRDFGEPNQAASTWEMAVTDGTSAAAPIVSGVVALVREANTALPCL